MKKIGIITFHRVNNYGAVLQSYALQKTIENLGYYAELIDYSMNAYMEKREKNKKVIYLKRLNKIIRNPVQIIKIIINEKLKKIRRNNNIKFLKERDKKFKYFQSKYQTLSKDSFNLFSDLLNTNLTYDAYVCGSDQIWNPNFCDNDSNYYLGFAPKNKRISYAPSFGVSQIPNNKRNIIAEMIKDIRFISIRERNGAEIISKLTGRRAEVVLDPTLLLTSEEWNTQIDGNNKNKTKTKSEPYILCYFIGDDKYIRKYLKLINTKYTSYKIVNLIFDYSNYGPIDFLFLVKDADFVVTNSFHGVIFSIIYNIPFIVLKTMKDYKKYSGFSRIEDILIRLNLADRIIEKDFNFSKKLLSLNFKYINNKLNEEREKSLNFLKKSIELTVNL